MINLVDKFLNRITMYRLTLYILTFYVVCAGVFTLFDLMPFNLDALFYSTAFLIAVCWVVNFMFAYAFRVPANVESVYITAFILALIILPTTEKSGFVFLFWAASIAMASKFILAIRRRHIFNPSAIAVVATFYILGQGASWWVGNIYMQIPLILGGFLIIRKIRRWSMATMFLATTVVTTTFFAFLLGTDTVLLLKTLVLYTPMFFFASVMFTEPSTTPASARLQLIYAIVVGILFSPLTHFGNFYFTPELALVVGNIFSFVASPKPRLMLTLVGKNKLGEGMHEFIFKPDRRLDFRPGQYLEWTLGHTSDSRGNRRYFTLASSPTEEDIRLGVRFYPEPSTFKKALFGLKNGTKLFAGQLAGDFTLPIDPEKKLVFIAGGIGVTPFRSMIKFLLDRGQRRVITLFYSNKLQSQIAYKNIFDEAGEKLGIKTIYTLTKEGSEGWEGERGRINPKMITRHAPDYMSRTFYISGSHSFVTGVEKVLRSMNIPSQNIETDFFPGF